MWKKEFAIKVTVSKDILKYVDIGLEIRMAAKETARRVNIFILLLEKKLTVKIRTEHYRDIKEN